MLVVEKVVRNVGMLSAALDECIFLIAYSHSNKNHEGHIKLDHREDCSILSESEGWYGREWRKSPVFIQRHLFWLGVGTVWTLLAQIWLHKRISANQNKNGYKKSQVDVRSKAEDPDKCFSLPPTFCIVVSLSLSLCHYVLLHSPTYLVLQCVNAQTAPDSPHLALIHTYMQARFIFIPLSLCL